MHAMGGVLYLRNIWTGYYSNHKEERKKKYHNVEKINIILAYFISQLSFYI